MHEVVEVELDERDSQVLAAPRLPEAWLDHTRIQPCTSLQNDRNVNSQKSRKKDTFARDGNISERGNAETYPDVETRKHFRTGKRGNISEHFLSPVKRSKRNHQSIRGM